MSSSFDHDVGGLDIAVNNVLSVHGSQSRQAVSNDCHGHTCFESCMCRPGRHDNVVDIVPSALRESSANFRHSVQPKQISQIIAVDPFHDQYADAIAINEVMDAEHPFVLDSGHRGRNLAYS